MSLTPEERAELDAMHEEIAKLQADVAALSEQKQGSISALGAAAVADSRAAQDRSMEAQIALNAAPRGSPMFGRLPPQVGNPVVPPPAEPIVPPVVPSETEAKASV